MNHPASSVSTLPRPGHFGWSPGCTWLQALLKRCKVQIRDSACVALWQRPVQVGVALQDGGWHVVLHEMSKRGVSLGPLTVESRSSSGVEQHHAFQHRWLPGAEPFSATTLPDLSAVRAQDDASGGDWRTALQAVLAVLPAGPCHLVVSWPDEALGISAVTVPGPLSAVELLGVLEQELAAVLPSPLTSRAWDVRWPVALHPASRSGWRAIMDALRVGWLGVTQARAAREALPWEGDLALRYWSISMTSARQLLALERDRRLASVTLEPASVSLERAASHGSAGGESALQEGAGWSSNEAMAAWGASCRRDPLDPDLLRQPRSTLEGWRWRVFKLGPWVLGASLALGAGYVAGASQEDRWWQERQAAQRRLSQLQDQKRALDERHQALQRVHREAQIQAEQAAYNLRFVQWLQGWAATVPDGLRWQQLSLQPSRIDLQGRAIDVDRLSRWVGRWSDVLPPGVDPRIQWQPAPVNVMAAAGDPTLELSIQLSWGSVREAQP